MGSVDNMPVIYIQRLLLRKTTYFHLKLMCMLTKEDRINPHWVKLHVSVKTRQNALSQVSSGFSPPETGLNFRISLTEMGENFTDSTSSSLELHTSLTKQIL